MQGMVWLWAALLLGSACGSDDGGGNGGGGGGGDCSASPGGLASFREHAIDSSRVHGQGLQIVDMNGDGKDDVVVAFSLTDAVYIYLNGCENWERIEVAPPGSMIATGVAVADYDDDGDLDIAVVEPFARDSDDGSVRWYENPGQLDGPWTEHDITGNTISGPLRIEAADLSGDGRMDLVVSTGSYGPGVMWFLNTGGDFSGPNAIDADLANVYSMLVHDVDGDGALDVVTSTFDDEEISWYRSDRGSGPSDTITFSKHLIDSVAAPYGLALGNLDDDPELELVASHARGVEIYDPGADPTAAWSTQSLTSDYAGDTEVFIQIADFNGDLQNDVVLVSGSSGSARAFLRDGNGFGELEIAQNYAGFNALQTGDIDGDGDLDLVTSTYEHGGATDLISWWENRP